MKNKYTDLHRWLLIFGISVLLVFCTIKVLYSGYLDRIFFYLELKNRPNENMYNFIDYWQNEYYSLLKEGMSKQDVLQLTGPPLNDPHDDIWIWTVNNNKVSVPDFKDNSSWDKLNNENHGLCYYLLFYRGRLCYPYFMSIPQEYPQDALENYIDYHNENGDRHVPVPLFSKHKTVRACPLFSPIRSGCGWIEVAVGR